MQRRIYVDTSVVGGCFDPEFRNPSRELFGRFENGQDLMLLSDLTLLELDSAPPWVRELPTSLPETSIVAIELGREAYDLATEYVKAGVVGVGMMADAQHIAAATLHRADVLVSWNLEHIVNLRRIHGFNSVNLRHGYPILEIRNPREVLIYETD